MNGRSTLASSTGVRPTVPWRIHDLTVVTSANVLGAIGLLAAWIGGRNETNVASQLGWLKIGIAAVVIAGAGNAAWILAGMRAVGLRRHEQLVRTPGTLALATTRASAGHRVARQLDGALVHGPLMTRYHRASCPAVANRMVEPASLAEHLEAGRQPCGICCPAGWIVEEVRTA
jgi:hypothetical protein